jgi:hypothetical protein
LAIVYDQFGIAEVEGLLGKLNPRVLVTLTKQIPEAEKIAKSVSKDDVRSS